MAATGEIGMQRFIHRLNIERYEKLLQTVTAEAERKRILRLLEEEKRSSFGQLAREKEKAGIARFTLRAKEAKHRTENESTHQDCACQCHPCVGGGSICPSVPTAGNMCKARCSS
jgi:hypothetical protein